MAAHVSFTREQNRDVKTVRKTYETTYEALQHCVFTNHLPPTVEDIHDSDWASATTEST